MWALAAAKRINTQQLLLKSVPWLIGVVVALCLLGWLILKLREWLNEDDGSAVDSTMLLTQFREMQSEGDLSDEEFRSIKRKLIASPSSRELPDPQETADSTKPGKSTQVDS
ncbi:hypothetical protein VT03_28445 [Planctomyces sp. SH-PL14]|nr:hypothetical protein VT03_28445 [Planctomyces sp. SH-PL14]